VAAQTARRAVLGIIFAEVLCIGVVGVVGRVLAEEMTVTLQSRAANVLSSLGRDISMLSRQKCKTRTVKH